MATSTTSSVYIHVIEDVVNKVREEFVSSDGPGEVVLNELQALWETKMMQAGVILGPIERPVAPPRPAAAGAAAVHDLNMPYEGTEEYETPTAEILFPPTPLQTPIQTPLPGMVQTPVPGTADNSSMYNIPTGGSDYPTPQDTGGSTELKGARPSPYMSHSPWMSQRPPLDVNVAYEEAREEGDRRISNQPLTQDFFTMPSAKRRREDYNPNYQNGGYIPQQDGAGDSEDFPGMMNNSAGSIGGLTSAHLQPGKSSKIPQLDGPMPDPYDDALSTPNIYQYQRVVSEDYNIANTPAPDLPAATPIPAVDHGDYDEDEPLNENDDDDLDDVDDGEELNTQHLVLAQFDKVSRTKSRWKCTLKDGIMHINNKDILFNKAMGEFDF
uniref:Uncharacterized protein n=1 Tax=Kalanchoe fedtschenkoi TaxID=63787 RepID=A0A7N0UKK9_KALFE